MYRESIGKAQEEKDQRERAGEQHKEKEQEEKEGLSEGERIRAMKVPMNAWFEQNARDLPWRKNPSPYQVWVSEIMLQQTRVEAVKPYYQRWMEKFPSIEVLAGAEDDVLMKMWEGLGYYRRAKNLKAAAVKVCRDYQGSLPASYEALRKLPGIGEYTAGAVASLAFGIPVPAVDGNALRVLSRLLGSFEDVSLDKTKKRFAGLLKENMDKERPGIFNQGLFEVGAMLCLPKGEPRCTECPLAHLCVSAKKGLWDKIPVKSAKKARRIEEKTVYVICSKTKVALQKRPDHGLLASLYEFPNQEGTAMIYTPYQAEEKLGLEPGSVQSVYALGEAKHIFSHVEWRMVGYHIEIDGELPETWICADIRDLEEKYPIPSAFLAYKKALL